MATTIATTAFAHGKASGIVCERMAAMAKFDGPLDTSAIANASMTLAMHSGPNLTALFPEGSTKHSKATPLAWTQTDDFSPLAQDLTDLGNSLAKLPAKPS